MGRKLIIISILISVFILNCFAQKQLTIQNKYLARTVEVKNGKLVTKFLVNKLNGQKITPSSNDEFQLRISSGTDKPETDTILTTANFIVKNFKKTTNKNQQQIIATLYNKKNNIRLIVKYALTGNDKFIRKSIELTPSRSLTLERIDIEAMNTGAAIQPYTISKITSQAHAQWKPGLGQPLYDTSSATFWGTEFPAATNYVNNGIIYCGYLWGNKLEAGQTYKSYQTIYGVADKYKYIDDAFYSYINTIRIRPLRLQIQYNSWFDLGVNVNKDNFANSIRMVNDELVVKRKLPSLNAYVIDDGWQDSRRQESDWSDTVWKINNKFSHNFKSTLSTVDSLHSHLGLWLSPGSFFGARQMVKKMGKAGLESLELSMSMTGPKYMNKLEQRLLELTKNRIAYFKLDGLFGHLNIRDFELQGRGTPAMPQLNLGNLVANDSSLNNPKYDELKTYYLVNGTERLITIFNKMAAINPDIFIAITNGAYLSPWWLQYVDVVWMINAGDASDGSNRTEELVYRDGIYYEIWKTDHTKFPMDALFNHEPKKTATGESEKNFLDYLLMNLSRGTGFIELYLKTNELSTADWDILAKGLKWSYHVFPCFSNTHMHGGNPRKGEVYGYSAWDKNKGYISIHNPSNEKTTYQFTLNRDIGVPTGTTIYYTSSPTATSIKGLNNNYKYGQTVTVHLQPKEIKIVNFDKTKEDRQQLVQF